jgi:anti-anti-sigma factor
MDCRYRSTQGLARIELAGRIESEDTSRLREPFLRAQTAGLNRVELDFSGVVYIGSAGIATLLQMHKAVTTRGGSLCIVSPPSNIASMFRSLKLDKLFEIQL